MDKVIELSKKINQELLSMREVQEYLCLKKEIDNCKELKDLSNQINSIKDKSSVEYKSLKQRYDSNPLVVNYLVAQEEVLEILRVINKSINI